MVPVCAGKSCEEGKELGRNARILFLTSIFTLIAPLACVPGGVVGFACDTRSRLDEVRRNFFFHYVP